jgi:hypothetical protein
MTQRIVWLWLTLDWAALPWDPTKTHSGLSQDRTLSGKTCRSGLPVQNMRFEAGSQSASDQSSIPGRSQQTGTPQVRGAAANRRSSSGRRVKNHRLKRIAPGRLAKLADAPDLGSGAARRRGSSPRAATWRRRNPVGHGVFCISWNRRRLGTICFHQCFERGWERPCDAGPLGGAVSRASMKILRRIGQFRRD